VIEQVVRDLEGQADVPGITAQMCAAFGRHAAKNGSHFHRRAKQGAGLELLQASDGGQVEI
jgi:hypothetical protein